MRGEWKGRKTEHRNSKNPFLQTQNLNQHVWSKTHPTTAREGNFFFAFFFQSATSYLPPVEKKKKMD